MTPDEEEGGAAESLEEPSRFMTNKSGGAGRRWKLQMCSPPRRCQIRFHDSSGSLFTGGSELGGQKIRFMSWELDAESRC